MLAKKYRLSARRVLRQKPSYRSRHFIFREQKNTLPFSRFGVVVGRSVHKKAARRNKIKRIIFNFIRLKRAHLRAGRDILIFVLPGAAGLKNEEIQNELNNFLDDKRYSKYGESF